MIGYHAVSVLADMIVKGVKGFDYERAYEAMKTTALNEHYDCLPDYMRNGYVPFDKEAESVSKHWNMPMTTIVSHRLPKLWARWTIISIF